MSVKQTIAAMVTPFRASGRVDMSRTEQLLEHLVDGGVQGVLVAGSQGEFYAVEPQDKIEMVARVLSAARKRVDVYAGIGESYLPFC